MVTFLPLSLSLSFPGRCHQPRDSLFSWSSGFNDFTGLVNWGFLLLTMGGFRLLLENFIKYGIRIDPIQWFYVLTGRNEGEGIPSLILIACKWGRVEDQEATNILIYSLPCRFTGARPDLPASGKGIGR